MSFGIPPGSGSLLNHETHPIRDPRQEASTSFGHTVQIVQRSTSCPTLSEPYKDNAIDNPVPVPNSYSTEKIALLREKSSEPALQWSPLFNMVDIKSAMKARPTELNYNGLMIRLTNVYNVDFIELSELLPRHQCQNIPCVTDPTEHRLLSRKSPFYRAYFDNYANFQKDTSKFYLLIKILEAERTLVNPDIQLPAYSGRPTESHATDQGFSRVNPLVAKAKAVRSIFFIDLLNHFATHKRRDFQNSLSQFINKKKNSDLKQDLLTFFPFVTDLWKLRKPHNKTEADQLLSATINRLHLAKSA
ncbi:hypothetical protein [Endozoicomonas sp.]|uniref:hypothetical protein n=1 Tax=Endozoicomonas sp. TaxID=1892382 RepID=UPI0028869C6C|nr:hypothetical protein [Endozoicomonas sp.]